ncbi:hypothetical protein CVIRNUC_001312 [Coccomyxa viridis]|uniref:Uncharacterized protein n=1 Tax=Coccomyxa viridis TaxID=1274662 RepID=A0AAV1HSY2_9CHLO|nr:hypothetical protein CVIRNUC_001312 [Coccomyxa viridis]
MAATADGAMYRPCIMVGDRCLSLLSYDQAIYASNVDFEQLNDCLEDLGLGSFGLDLTLKVWKSPDLRVLLARAKALLIDFATHVEESETILEAYNHAQYQVSMLQGENQQLAENLHAVNTAAADAFQRAALLERQLRDVCHQLKESQEAGISADFRLSAAEADLDESRQRLRETQVRVEESQRMNEQEKISAEAAISELRHSLEQTHVSNAALQDALHQERAKHGSQEDRLRANTAAFVEALQQERAKSAAQQQALEALRDELAATVSMPAELAAVRDQLRSSQADQLAIRTQLEVTQEDLQESQRKKEQEKLGAEGTVSELRQSLEQTHASNAALQNALYRERARNVSQEESHWANTAAFMEALQQERAKSAAQQQALEALRDEMTARQAQPSPQAQPAPTTVSLPGGFLGLTINIIATTAAAVATAAHMVVGF